MSATAPGRIVILSGPSCVGKSPLLKALKRFHPDLAQRLRDVVLYNDRAPRPGEVDGVDYHFRRRGEIEKLRESDRYVVMEVRGDLQALDLDELDALLDEGDAFFEGNPFVGKMLLTDDRLAHCERLGIFLAPLSREEIEFLKDEPGADPKTIVADVMRRKLLRRTAKQKGNLSLADLEEIERRCGSAWSELGFAHLFPHVIPCHDGESSENWDAFYYPLGDARRALAGVVTLLQGGEAPASERWEADLIG